MGGNPDRNRTAAELRRENFTLRIGKDMAWVTYDQYAPNTGEATMDMPGLSRETKILEKHRGEWKLVYVGYLLLRSVVEDRDHAPARRKK